MLEALPKRAVLGGFTGRQDLDGCIAIIVEWRAIDERWEARVQGTGEVIHVKDE
eukprot:CAMPEP_0119316614 /NCGR_PEP_ID=MMETSP1333-20130426/40190_1 /TAXON_ID=418940 /ORGANISM="Scyphosphaera apsteinii, Strain RCC1455" /LENGTH=53 /DNA_ID=CAMNT_0007322303 /DNA_START=101 /DNA_END=259 /DNA_ORIENTATION=+